MKRNRQNEGVWTPKPKPMTATSCEYLSCRSDKGEPVTIYGATGPIHAMLCQRHQKMLAAPNILIVKRPI